MTTREKKTTITKDTNTEATTKEKENKKEIKIEENSNSNDMFSPENMSKMFAMFQQFQAISNVEQKTNTVASKEDISEPRFTSIQLGKISDELVMVKSTVDNIGFTSPKTNITYTWGNKGSVEPMTVSEILAMENVSTRFLHTPWLVVEDKRIIEALNLQRTYDLIKQVEDVNELVKLNKNEISRIFEELPKQYQNNFRNEIYRKVKTRELNNLSTIDDLGEILHIDLRNI